MMKKMVAIKLRGLEALRGSSTFRGRSFLLFSSSLSSELLHREKGVKHNIVDKPTNQVENPALHSEPAPAGLVVDGRDWVGAVDRALGCSSGPNSVLWLL